MSVAICLLAGASSAHAATKACDQHVVYARDGVRVAHQKHKAFTACLGRESARRLGKRLSRFTARGHHLVFARTVPGDSSISGETDYSQIDLRTGQRRAIGTSSYGETFHLKGITLSGTIAFTQMANSASAAGGALERRPLADRRPTTLATADFAIGSGPRVNPYPNSLALAADGTAYWVDTDSTLHMARRDEPVGAPERLGYRRTRLAPCTTNVAYKSGRVAVAMTSKRSATLCVGGRRRAGLGNAFGFTQAGRYIVYQARIGTATDLLALNPRTLQTTRLEVGGPTSSFRMAGAARGAVAWIRRDGTSSVPKFWRPGSPPAVVAAGDLEPNSFVLGGSDLYWRSADNQAHVQELS